MNSRQRRLARRAEQRRYNDYVAAGIAAGRIVPSEWTATGGSGYEQQKSAYADVVVSKPELSEFQKHQIRNSRHYTDSWGTGNHLRVVTRWRYRTPRLRGGDRLGCA